jgi:acetyltransferase
MNRLEYFLRPKSVAIIGASRKKGSLGKMFLDSIQRMRFTGNIYPVNPKADSINEIPCYPDVQSLPALPDLAIILLPVGLVLQSIEDLGKAGIKNVIVISAGFRETGEEGKWREKELLELAKQYDIRILGPNCMGVFNTDNRVYFNGTFSPILPNIGHVAFISQSGALGVGVLELSQNTGLGFSVFASTGNKADLSEADILEFLLYDQNTKVITIYLESIDNPAAFKKICGQISAVKPVLALKAGHTECGVKAASSHTGALANPEHIIDGFLKQSGVIRFGTLRDMFDSARALSMQPFPDGPRTAIITNAGGPAILASDTLENSGLTLADFSNITINKLKKLLPPEAATSNPVDMIASANHETYNEVIDTVLQDDGVDIIVMIIVRPPVNTTPKRIIEEIDPLLQNCDKPIVAVLMSRTDDDAGFDLFNKHNIPVYSQPEAAVKAMGTMWQYHQIQQRFRRSEAIVIHPEMEEPLVPTNDESCRQVSLDQIFELLEHYDIGIAPGIITDDPEDILKFYRDEDSALVLKIANEHIIHKSDSGLVHLGLNDEDSICTAFDEIIQSSKALLPKGAGPKVLAQKQMGKGIELVLGGKKDPMFGPVLMVGIGGIFVEVLNDVSFRIAPVNAYQAHEMINELRSQALLDEFRGHAAVDREAFAYTIQRFGLLLAEHPEIAEMDLNPLIWSATENKALVVDVRATLAD